MSTNKNKTIIIIVVIAAIFGLAAGIVGELVARAYLLDSALNIPFFGEINVSDGNYSGPSVIIRDAKNVVIEQNKQSIETINSASDIIVGIFKKIPEEQDIESSKKEVKKEVVEDIRPDFYNMDEKLGQGLILTSDGWIITGFLPKELTGETAGIINDKIILQEYVVITKNKEIYEIDSLIRDKSTSFLFIHVPVKDFPVRKLVNKDEINNGQSVIAVNWERQGMLTSIMDKRGGRQNSVTFSDKINGKIILTNSPKTVFGDGFLFNLTGDVVALIGVDGDVHPMGNFVAAIRSLLKFKSIKRASLGAYSLDLSSLVDSSIGVAEQSQIDIGALIYENEEGVAVVENSVADLAGLQAGDIVVSIGNREVNQENLLNEIIQDYIAGDEVDVVYLRKGERKEVKIKLGEIE